MCWNGQRIHWETWTPGRPIKCSIENSLTDVWGSWSTEETKERHRSAHRNEEVTMTGLLVFPWTGRRWLYHNQRTKEAWIGTTNSFTYPQASDGFHSRRASATSAGEPNIDYVPSSSPSRERRRRHRKVLSFSEGNADSVLPRQIRVGWTSGGATKCIGVMCCSRWSFGRTCRRPCHTVTYAH